MDTRIGHDSPDEALTARQRAQHVQWAFCFQSAARLEHVKFTHPDKQVKSERNLRNLARPKPFVSTVFEGFFRIACLHFSPERGVGLSISRTR